MMELNDNENQENTMCADDDDHDDIYGDLIIASPSSINTNLTENPLTPLAEDERKQYLFVQKELQDKVSLLEQTVQKLTREKEVLKKNISALFKTAKQDIDHRNERIASLQKRLDDLLFKRNKVMQLPNLRNARDCTESSSLKEHSEDESNKSICSDIDVKIRGLRETSTSSRAHSDEIMGETNHNSSEDRSRNSSTDRRWQPELNNDRYRTGRADNRESPPQNSRVRGQYARESELRPREDPQSRGRDNNTFRKEQDLKQSTNGIERRRNISNSSRDRSGPGTLKEIDERRPTREPIKRDTRNVSIDRSRGPGCRGSDQQRLGERRRSPERRRDESTNLRRRCSPESSRNNSNYRKEPERRRDRDLDPPARRGREDLGRSRRDVSPDRRRLNRLNDREDSGRLRRETSPERRAMSREVVREDPGRFRQTPESRPLSREGVREDPGRFRREISTDRRGSNMEDSGRIGREISSERRGSNPVIMEDPGRFRREISTDRRGSNMEDSVRIGREISSERRGSNPDIMEDPGRFRREISTERRTLSREGVREDFGRIGRVTPLEESGRPGFEVVREDFGRDPSPRPGFRKVIEHSRQSLELNDVVRRQSIDDEPRSFSRESNYSPNNLLAGRRVDCQVRGHALEDSTYINTEPNMVFEDEEEEEGIMLSIPEDSFPDMLELVDLEVEEPVRNKLPVKERLGMKRPLPEDENPSPRKPNIKERLGNNFVPSRPRSHSPPKKVQRQYNEQGENVEFLVLL